VSTHADTIQYANQAVQKVDELIVMLSGTDNLRSEIEACLRAAFTDTSLEAVAGMHHGMGEGIQTTLSQAVNLKETLQNTLAHLQATN
jgi:hypothetical protein